MRRRFGLIFIVLALLLSACGGGNSNTTSGTAPNKVQGLTSGDSYIGCPSSTSTTAAAPESGAITLNVSGWSSSPSEDALVQANLNKFHQLHPNITVRWNAITGDYPTKMRANIASGNVSDVFYASTDMAPEYISSGKLLDLSPYMAKDGVSASNYYSSLITPFSCKAGQVYGIPKDWNPLGVFYNKAMFSAAGLTAPSANWTWNDMRTDAKKLTKAGNAATSIYGLTLAGQSAQRWLAFLFSNGGSVLSADGTKATFNNQAGVDSLNWYGGFHADGSAVQPTDVGGSWAGDAFGKGRAAMAIEGGWLIPAMAQQYPSVDYGVAPLPVAPNGKTANLIFTNSWSAYSGTKHPEAAWELLKFMTSSQTQQSVLHNGFAMPTTKSLANDAYFASHPALKTLFDAASIGVVDNYGPQTSAIHTALDEAVEKVLLGKSDAKTALDDAANQVNTALQS